MEKNFTDFLAAKAIMNGHDLSTVPAWVVETANEFITNLNKPTKQNTIERAADFLCETDTVSIEEQVDSIAAHADRNDLIDFIDDVTVCEAFEYSFTCERFLDTIGWNDDYK